MAGIKGEEIVNTDELNKGKVLFDIEDERKRQVEKFGVQNHAPQWWLAILGEEVGEANKAALESHFAFDGTNKNVIDLYGEVIQCAAVAIAFAESLLRNEINEVFEKASEAQS